MCSPSLLPKKKFGLLWLWQLLNTSKYCRKSDFQRSLQCLDGEREWKHFCQKCFSIPSIKEYKQFHVTLGWSRIWEQGLIHIISRRGNFEPTHLLVKNVLISREKDILDEYSLSRLDGVPLHYWSLSNHPALITGEFCVTELLIGAYRQPIPGCN